MKVNISGVGLIPRVGLLAPVYGKDLTKNIIEQVLKYKSFKVYVASTGAQITLKNIDELYTEGFVACSVNTAKINNIQKASKKINKPTISTGIEEPAEEAPNVEETVVDTVPEVLPEITEKNINDVKEATPVAVESEADEDNTVVEETEEKPVHTNNKKKKRH
jgi:hypothetical protein